MSVRCAMLLLERLSCIANGRRAMLVCGRHFVVCLELVSLQGFDSLGKARWGGTGGEKAQWRVLLRNSDSCSCGGYFSLQLSVPRFACCAWESVGNIK